MPAPGGYFPVMDRRRIVPPRVPARVSHRGSALLPAAIRVTAFAAVLAALLATALAGCAVAPPPPPERRGAGGERSVSVPHPSRAEAAAIEAEVLRLVNLSRRRAGVGELALDAGLSEVARRHSRNMRDRDFFGHRDPAGREVGERLAAAGFEYRVAAENVAHVYQVPDPAAYLHRILMDSRGHRRNVLLPQARRAGVGVARSGTAYWLTEVFVAP